jgi:hypothetical protein
MTFIIDKLHVPAVSVAVVMTADPLPDEDSETEDYQKAAHLINPIIGQ